MSVFSRKNKIEERATINMADVFNMKYYGTIDQNYINSYTVFENEAVYAAVKVISESLAGLPINTFRKFGDERIKDNKYFLYETLNNPNEQMHTPVYSGHPFWK